MRITKENHAKFRELAMKAAQQRANERAQWLTQVEELIRTGPNLWRDRLEEQGKALHGLILHELGRGAIGGKKHSPVRLQRWLNCQKLIVSTVLSLDGEAGAQVAKPKPPPPVKVGARMPTSIPQPVVVDTGNGHDNSKPPELL